LQRRKFVIAEEEGKPLGRGKVPLNVRVLWLAKREKDWEKRGCFSVGHAGGKGGKRLGEGGVHVLRLELGLATAGK